jgi:integrase
MFPTPTFSFFAASIVPSTREQEDDRGPVGMSAACGEGATLGKGAHVHKPFYLTVRRDRGGVIYVRYTVDRPFGRGYDLTRPKSTHTSDMADAVKWAQDHKPRQPVIKAPLSERISFAAFVDGDDSGAKFWTPQHDFVRREAARGHDYSPVYLANNLSITQRILKPVLGSYKIGEITSVMCDDLSLVLRDPAGYVGRSCSLGEQQLAKLLQILRGKQGALRPLAAESVNKHINALRDIFKHAIFLGILREGENPVRKVRRHSDPTRKPRGILSISEARALFDESTASSVWRDDVVMYTINLVAASTGLRLGELQGLQRRHVHLAPRDIGERAERELLDEEVAEVSYINVAHGWRQGHGLAKPKADSFGKIPLTAQAERWLRIVMERSQYADGEDLVFAADDAKRVARGFSSDPGKIPVSHRWVERNFYASLKCIGIDRLARNITFHGWRHFFVTVTHNAGATDYIARALSRHKSAAAHARYEHPDPATLKPHIAPLEGIGG